MSGNQVAGDGLSMNLAGMSKNQLYDIMAQMKTLIEQNQDQARHILIQNPLLTKALFQAQIMLGMLEPPEEIPNIQPTASQQPAPPPQQSNTPPTQSSQTTPPPPAQQSSHPLQQPIQHNRSHMSAQLSPIPSQQSNPSLPPHYATQPAAMPAVNTPLQQQPSHMPLQPPLPPQPRPPSVGPNFPHQNYSHVGPAAAFQHQGPPQMHHSQPMFHSGSRPPSGMGPPFSQGQSMPPNQQSPYQGGSGMDYNQMERGSNWMPPGLSNNAAGGTPFLPPHMGSASQPPQPTSSLISGDMEKVLLQQVMSLTPEQINLLPPDQRNQLLHLQQMFRH